MDRAYFDSWVQRVRQQVEEVDTVASKARDATLEVVGEQQVLHLIQQAEERLKGLFASREDLAEHAQLALESLGSKVRAAEAHLLRRGGARLSSYSLNPQLPNPPSRVRTP